jgi:hypothetical protein
VIIQGIIGNDLRGKVNCYSLDDAQPIADFKRSQGLRVRINNRPLTQGKRVHPVTVSWWVG